MIAKRCIVDGEEASCITTYLCEENVCLGPDTSAITTNSSLSRRALVERADATVVEFTGIKNFCLKGHHGLYCTECDEGLLKGDDGICRECRTHSLWVTIRIKLVYGMVYGLYSSYRSGRPDSLKSSKSANRERSTILVFILMLPLANSWNTKTKRADVQ